MAAQLEYARFLDMTVALLDDESEEPPWPLMALELQAAMRANAALFQDDRPPPTSTGPVLAWTRSPSVARANKYVLALRRAHPLGELYVAGEKSVLRVSDVTDDRSWRRNPVYNLCRRDVDGAIRHLGVPIPGAAGAARLFLICRPGLDYTDHEVSLMRRVQPLLFRLDRHLAELSRLRTRAEAPAELGRRANALGLTPRQLTVLALLAEGLTARAIARRLGITEATVSKHQENLYRKLGCKDRLGAVLTAQRGGLFAR
ncbi:LuxR C-terminal-related transcriptional regulator [Actinoplanes sp. M2I2]|uniref:response regulator transcription factor n=1 Tax=Actinoplanes sp. M2I2 TaxID=1734444 RepID=UPI0020204221|nr:LuxR C-terminal-related transcriptional regulator [Actinoplanes sp. M2I2]